MITISAFVRDWLEDNLAIANLLESGLINHSALARAIKPEIEQRSGEKVSIESVTIALNRAGKTLAQQDKTDPLQFIGDVSVQTGLDILIYEIADFDKLQHPDPETLQQGFYVSTRGIWHASIIATSTLANSAELKSTAVEHQRNVTAITIRLKAGHIPIPGVCAGILSLLAYKNVNLQEVISTHNELTIFTDQPNAQRALNTLWKVKNPA